MMKSFLTIAAIISMASGWFYYIYVCIIAKSYALLIAGFFVPVISAPIGLWSLLFGAPKWLTGWY
jgi:hypothetical protein